MENDQNISILGTGDYARALTRRLTRSGKSVICGSRYPRQRNLAKRDPELAKTKVTVASIEEALRRSRVIFLALHAEHIKQTLEQYSEILVNKVRLISSSHHLGVFSKFLKMKLLFFYFGCL